MTDPAMRDRVGPLLAACAMAATVPYVLLKIAWLSGHYIGALDTGMLASPTFVVANAVTLLLDLAVVVVAAALGWQWGLRLPAWLVLGPMWVATGLLVTVAVGASVAALLALVLRLASTAVGVPGLRPWVFAVVYTGFALQALLLSWLFVRYLRARWPGLLAADRAPTADVRTVRRALDVTTGPVRRAVDAAAILLCTAVAVLDGVIATFGHPPWSGVAGVRPMPDRVSAAVTALAALLGISATAVLRRRLRDGRSLFGPLAVVWTATGSMVAWGLYTLVVALVLPASTPSVRVDEVEIIAGVLLVLAVAGTLRSDPASGRSVDGRRARAGRRVPVAFDR
jgi:hypothetical protein